MPIIDFNGTQVSFPDDMDEATLRQNVTAVAVKMGLSQEKPKTSAWEDIKLATGGALKTLATGKAMLAPFEPLYNPAALLAPKTQDQQFKEMEQRQAEIEQATAVPGKEQTFGGKLLGVAATLPLQLAAMPFSPAQTGKEMIDLGEDVSAAQKAALIDTAGNVAGIALPGGIGGTLAKRAVTGAGIGAAQDVATRMGIQQVAETEQAKEYFAPTLETTGIAGVLGAGVGAISRAQPKPRESVLSSEELAAFGEEVPTATPSKFDIEIEAKEQPRFGEVERILPTEEGGLTPARMEDVVAAQSRVNQAIIDAETSLGRELTQEERAEVLKSKALPEEPTFDSEINKLTNDLREAEQSNDQTRIKNTLDQIEEIRQWEAGKRVEGIKSRDALNEAWKTERPLGGTGVSGFRQGGAVDPTVIKDAYDKLKGLVTKTKSPEPAKTLDEFTQRGLEAGYTKEQIDRAWNKLQEQRKPELISKKIEKIPGLEGMAPVAQRAYEEMLPQWKSESDIDYTPAKDLLRSGGRMKSLQTGNSLVNWAVEKIYGEKRRSEVIQKEAERQIISEMNGLKKTLGDTGVIEAVAALQEVEGTTTQARLNPKAVKFSEAIRSSMDALHKATSELKGRPVTYRPNYLAGVFTGPYRSIVKNAEDKVVGVIAGKTIDDARAGVEYFRKEFPDLNIPEPAFSQSYKSAEFSRKFDQLAVHNNELLSIFGETPEGQRFLDAADKYYKKRMYKHMDYYQHFKSKKGVIGAEGTAPWRDAKDNAYDMINAQLKVLEDGWEWVAAQKASKDIRKLLADPELAHMPNAKDYIVNYFGKAFNKGQESIFKLDPVIDTMARSLGVEPKTFHDASQLLRNFTMSQVLGWNPAFWFTQVAQVPQAMITTTSFLKENGIGAGIKDAYEAGTIGMYDASASTTKNIDSLTQPGKFFHDYAIKNGVYDPQLIEHRRVGKFIPTTGMSKTKRVFVDNLLNHPYHALDVFAKTSAKYSIELLESKTRAAYFMSTAHYIHKSGYSLKDAAEMADKLTSTMFVDYHPTERPAIWGKLGDLGTFASAVSTYKFNYLNQLATMAGKKNYKTLATMGLVLWSLTGMQGMPGMDEVDEAVKFATNGAVSPKSMMLTSADNLLYYGALSEMTGMALQTKFSQADLLPDDPLNFLYPLISYWKTGLGKTWEAVKTPTKETIGAALQAGLPGGLKALPETHMLTEDGVTLLPGTTPSKTRSFARGTKETVARALGTYSNLEARAKEVSRDIITQMNLQNVRQEKRMNKVLTYWLAGDDENLITASQDFVDNGGNIDSLTRAIEQLAINMNINVDEAARLKYQESQSPERQEILQRYE